MKRKPLNTVSFVIIMTWHDNSMCAYAYAPFFNIYIEYGYVHDNKDNSLYIGSFATIFMLVKFHLDFVMNIICGNILVVGLCIK